MLQQKEFTQWFEQQVKARWSRHNYEWIELGDWYWRLRDFDIETLTEAVRKHKACEDYRTPSLKKVYEYAKTIRKNNSPKCQRRDETNARQNGVPEAHTYIMCVEKDENGRGCVGWFVPILIWPFHKTYTAETYCRTSARPACSPRRRVENLYRHNTL